MNRVTRLQNFARAGFAARGVVYILLGYFALRTSGTATQGSTGVLEQILRAPLGGVLLALVGIGLIGYGIFRLYGAMLDLEGEGGGFKGRATRVGHAASGFAHIFLGYYAFQLLLGNGAGSGDQGQDLAAWLLTQPFGNAVLALIGIGLMLAALNQLREAVTARFMWKLDANAPAFAKHMGRAGYAARFVVFAIIGWKVASAALSGDTSQVGDFGEALIALGDQPTLLTIVAIGLILFGLFGFVMAIYARIRDEDVIARLKQEARARI